MKLTATDAEVSARLEHAVDAAKQRARRLERAMACLRLENTIRRRLRPVLQHLHATAAAASLSKRLHATSCLQAVVMSVARRRYRESWRRLAATEAASTRHLHGGGARPLEVAECLRPRKEAISEFSTGAGMVSHTPRLLEREQLGRRADALLRLKVRLCLRQDFAARLWHANVPATMVPTATGASRRRSGHRDAESDEVESELEKLSFRLSRGAACLLEYVLGSVVRARLRNGVNAMLAACEASCLVECVQPREKLRPRSHPNT
eukprot:gnl/TRDRNA2_/TRDRNA2_153572_c2_seq1.p1 gnl/TRDRNA2_/TRDRNA2_153572_c2~~gnl/TRDRNA2_/TRDRNA2_153572_c2_seq1.p1  ORF type:complete len:265 (+),score=42.97 gnl/TRDRNA2_/TRDRNA2_153572_c2_seq1:770-1564(+)